MRAAHREHDRRRGHYNPLRDRSEVDQACSYAIGRLAEAGWLLSPNFRPNEQLAEVRYQWRPRDWPAIDVRVRWREDLEQQTTAVQKRERFDAFLRFTWQFDL